MPRTVLVLTALLCSLCPALASLSSRPPAPAVGDPRPIPSAAPLPQDRPLSDDALQAVYPQGRKDEFRITSQTAVFVDGWPCNYADVPRSAKIVNMEISTDNQTVLKIQFRTRK